MKNRYGVEYCFESINENTYTIVGNFGDHWRFGGLEGQDGVDCNSLGFVDPAGGPFMSIGGKIEGRKITRIYLQNEKILFEVE